MSVDDRVYLGHMLDLCAKIHQRVARCSRADFDRSEDLRIVITHLIQTLGEAARHVSADLRRRHPEVP